MFSVRVFFMSLWNEFTIILSGVSAHNVLMYKHFVKFNKLWSLLTQVFFDVHFYLLQTQTFLSLFSSLNAVENLQPFSTCRNLQQLYLRNNNVSDLREICHLKELDNLTRLWLSDNPCTETSNYRHTVIKTLPQLTLLDNVGKLSMCGVWELKKSHFVKRKNRMNRTFVPQVNDLNCKNHSR